MTFDILVDNKSTHDTIFKYLFKTYLKSANIQTTWRLILTNIFKGLNHSSYTYNMRVFRKKYSSLEKVPDKLWQNSLSFDK